jgi:class 3 adenylate cyclase
LFRVNAFDFAKKRNLPENEVIDLFLHATALGLFSQPDRALILKIGIHKGAAIAVTLNERLDYFGQTVNIAARVQQPSDAGEIFISEDVHSAENVQALLGSELVQSNVFSKACSRICAFSASPRSRRNATRLISLSRPHPAESAAVDSTKVRFAP